MSEPSGHPVEPETGDLGLDSRIQFMRQAVKVWTGELVDLGGQNRLLYYRDLKQGTLDLGAENGANGIAVGDLTSSRPTRLSLMFGATALPPAARRARTIKAKAQENFEERGLQTLFLAMLVPDHLGVALEMGPEQSADAGRELLAGVVADV